MTNTALTNSALTNRALTNTALTLFCMLMALIVGGIAIGQDSQQAMPLTAEQVVKVRAVLLRTKTEQTELRKKLGESQSQLASCYTEFELDEPRISQLHADIVAAQRKLMDSHHVLHQEMRSILGIERFKSLAKRIELYLTDHATDADPKAKQEKPRSEQIQLSTEPQVKP